MRIGIRFLRVLDHMLFVLSDRSTDLVMRWKCGATACARELLRFEHGAQVANCQLLDELSHIFRIKSDTGCSTCFLT